MPNPREVLQELFSSSVIAVSPTKCVVPTLPLVPSGQTIVVGAGKASAAMARAVEEHWSGKLSGLVVTRYGHAVPCEHIEIIEAGHPVPDSAGFQAANRMLQLVGRLTEDDLVLALMSGGGSSLLPCPAKGLTLADEQYVNKQLLISGATISEMNCVRKHISRIKGGRLALAAYPARVLSLIISDVPNDIASDVASGPTLPDPTTCADALAVLEKYRIEEPAGVLAHLRRGTDETPKPDDPMMARVEYRVVARARDALDAAANAARSAGIEPIILGDNVEGEAREVAKKHAEIAKRYFDGSTSAKRPCVLLSGGETTVAVRGKGRGGRNSEYALALALALNGHRAIHALAADTDGIDGTEDNAGAVVGPDTLHRASALGLGANAYLADNNAYEFFAALGDLVVTGPTLTNVNDFRAILIE